MSSIFRSIFWASTNGIMPYGVHIFSTFDWQSMRMAKMPLITANHGLSLDYAITNRCFVAPKESATTAAYTEARQIRK